MGVRLKKTIIFASYYLCLIVSLSGGAEKESISTRLEKLNLAQRGSDKDVKSLIQIVNNNNQTLAQVLLDPSWQNRFKLKSQEFKATVYYSNPFDLLPLKLQTLLKGRERPFETRNDIWEWLKKHDPSPSWKKAMKIALRQTTPRNLWRSSQGKSPFAKGGKPLKPLIIDHGNRNYELRDGGHIATDPSIIPTHSNVWLIFNIKGKDRIVYVSAADTGGNVKGKHVDLPIKAGSDWEKLPGTKIPKSLQITNLTVLTPTLPVSESILRNLKQILSTGKKMIFGIWNAVQKE
ncbi:hypothetical protein BVX98_07330 [bacterium F11]|nr:hypothetical protein BVX98_07330 [bacterium F11]